MSYRESLAKQIGDQGEPPEARMHGTYGQLEYDEEADALLCHVCGGWYKHLAQHAKLAHHLTADEYRETFGLNRGTRLITPSMRDRLRERSLPLIARLRSEGKLRNWAEDSEKFRGDKAAAVETLHGGLRAEGRGHRREAFTEERRREQSMRRRERNLAGVDRASGEAISRGLRAVAGPPRPCTRCEREYEPTMPRQLYCDGCRPEVERERGRESKRRARLRQSEGQEAAPRRTDPLAREYQRDWKRAHRLD